MRTIMLLVAVVCLSAPAAAQQVKPGHTNAPEGGATVKKSPFLTVNECKGLGGTVSRNAAECGTGMKCTIQETGKEQCITSKE